MRNSDEVMGSCDAKSWPVGARCLILGEDVQGGSDCCVCLGEASVRREFPTATIYMHLIAGSILLCRR
jgi:hypothetical protein